MGKTNMENKHGLRWIATRTVALTIVSFGVFLGISPSLQSATLYTVTSANKVLAYDTTNMAAGYTVFIDGGSGMPSPQGIAGNGGNFYIASYDGNRVVEYSSVGTGVQNILSTRPAGLAFGGGKMYVANNAGNEVNIFSSSFVLELSFGSSYLNAPSGVYVDSGNVYVTNSASGINTIIKFDLAGNYVSTISAAGLSRPNWITADSIGNFYVSNYQGGGGTVTKYDSSWNLLMTIGSGTLSSSQGVVVDELGNIFVSNGASGISVFNSAGSFVGSYATEGSPVGLLLVPEPSAIYLLLGAVAGFVFLKRRGGRGGLSR